MSQIKINISLLLYVTVCGIVNLEHQILFFFYIVLTYGPFFLSFEFSEGERPAQNEKRKEKNIKRGGNRFEPYANPTKRYRAFITNIPFDVKWQSLKDLVKEKGNGTGG